MSRGYTPAMPADRRARLTRRQNARQLRDLVACREFYYNNRHRYTAFELDNLDEAVRLVQESMQ